MISIASMRQLLIATTNPGKLAEIKEFLSDVPVELLSLNDLKITVKPEETGKMFEENAILKAKFYAKISGLPTLADDGGFEIDALGGEPGVKSHRWIHGDRDDSDEELIDYTIKRMMGLPRAERGAQLRLVLALIIDGKVYTAEAKIRGIIPDQPSAHLTPGFPYRSLLYLTRYGKFYNPSELTKSENSQINHRKKAVEKLKPIIKRLLTG